MIQPVRIQLSRKRGFNLQAHSLALNGLPAVKVSRPGTFGNPFTVQDAADVFDCRTESAHRHAVRWFDEWINLANRDERLDDLGSYGGTRERHARIHAEMHRLQGHNLACFCRLGLECHADVLLRIAPALADRAGHGESGG